MLTEDLKPLGERQRTLLLKEKAAPTMPTYLCWFPELRFPQGTVEGQVTPEWVVVRRGAKGQDPSTF